MSIADVPLYKGTMPKMSLGLLEDDFITIPSGQYQRLSIKTKVPKYVEAPFKKGDKIGELVIQFDSKIIDTKPLFALNDAPQGGFFSRLKDAIRLLFVRWFG